MKDYTDYLIPAFPVILLLMFLFVVGINLYEKKSKRKVSDRLKKRTILGLFDLFILAFAFIFLWNFVSPLFYKYSENKNIWYGYIDKKGKEVIPFKFRMAGKFHHGCAYVRTDSAAFWIDSLGRSVPAPKISNKDTDAVRSRAEDFEDKDAHPIGYTETTGPYYESLAVTRLWQGYDHGDPLNRGRITGIFCRYGYKDTNGNIVIKPVYLRAYGFREGLAAVSERIFLGHEVNGKASFPAMGYINSKGEYLIKPCYFYAGDFSEGKAAVAKNDDYYVIEANLKNNFSKRQFAFIPLIVFLVFFMVLLAVIIRLVLKKTKNNPIIRLWILLLSISVLSLGAWYSWNIISAIINVIHHN